MWSSPSSPADTRLKLEGGIGSRWEEVSIPERTGMATRGHIAVWVTGAFDSCLFALLTKWEKEIPAA